LQDLTAHLALDCCQQLTDLGGDLRGDLGAEVVRVSRIIRSMKAMKGAESVWRVLS
jgi:hypothetical protein